MTHPLASDKPTICCVCRSQSMPLGYRPSLPIGEALPLIWVCADPICQSLITKVYGMPSEKLVAYEKKAALSAGDAAGQFLDEIGKTDLAAMSQDEWHEFLGHIVLGYQSELQRMIQEDEAPF